MQPTVVRGSGLFNKMHGTLRALHVSQQCLYNKNCSHVYKGTTATQ